MILYIGRNAVPLLLNDLFGPSCNSLSDLDPLQSTIPELDTQLSQQVRNTISYIRETRPTRALHVQIARQTMDGAEHEFASLLTEDRNNEAQAYHEYLAYLHRQINMEVLFLFSLSILTGRRVETGIGRMIACGRLDFLIRLSKHKRILGVGVRFVKDISLIVSSKMHHTVSDRHSKCY